MERSALRNCSPGVTMLSFLLFWVPAQTNCNVSVIYSNKPPDARCFVMGFYRPDQTLVGKVLRLMQKNMLEATVRLSWMAGRVEAIR